MKRQSALRDSIRQTIAVGKSRRTGSMRRRKPSKALRLP
jgi:hypothetical protein